MTFTARIRIYLLLVAVLPSLAIMLGVYFYIEKQIESSDRQLAHQSLMRYDKFHDSFIAEIEEDIGSLLKSPSMTRALTLIKSNRAAQVKLSNKPTGLDFLEILDSGFRVMVSYHRPGLLGNVLPDANVFSNDKPDKPHATVEYDINGPHAAYAYLIPVENDMYLYTGRYLDNRFVNLARQLLGAEISITFSDANGVPVARMETGHLYQADNHLQALLAGNKTTGFYMVADFPPGVKRPVYRSLLLITGAVATASVLFALILGFYITGKAKREIDNLIDATAKVASGDFSSPVMAYEEGEFAQLADSFTDMTFKLKEVQQQLATSEKIAAWQVMGRKVAHEIKNPLTPIAISADDLRRSYREQTTDFSKVLDETTRTIKTEVNRLTKLLDQFVSFARMSPPKIIVVSLQKMIDELSTLYRHEIELGKLIVYNNTDNDTVKLDPDMIKQALVNLIKNGFESGSEVKVVVTFMNVNNNLEIKIEDDGPGFSEEILNKSPQPYMSTKKEGSGLGLVICQRIIHDHGGAIKLYNRTEGGAGVSVILLSCYG